MGTPENFYAQKTGLTMWGGYTAGDWMYIGSQGIVREPEVFASAARELTDSLKDALFSRAVLEVWGAQPLAGTMNGGVVLAVEVDPERIKRRIETGYCQVLSTDLDDALKRCLKAKEKGEALSVGLVGNAAVVFPEILRRGIVPEIVTDQTSAHDALYGYVPAGMTLQEADDLRQRNPEEMVGRRVSRWHSGKSHAGVPR
jgi:urocanate hydratase